MKLKADARLIIFLMDKEFRLNLNDKQIVQYVKLILTVLLLVIIVIICAQYITKYIEDGGLAKLIIVIASCGLLAVAEISDSFVIKNFTAKMVFYGVDSVLLFIICLTTGNSYLSALYCIVLTQFYISVNDLKKNSILFGVSCGLYAVSFVCGWIVSYSGDSPYQVIVQVFGDCVTGVVLIAIDFMVINFILRFYVKHVQLRQALQEADESKARLKDVYEKFSQTAVYEERNRIAKDIHDNAGHSMTTVIMQTEAAKLLIDSNPEEAKNRIISANIQAKNALEQMRQSVHLLAGRAQARTLREEIEEIIAQTIDGTELKIRYDLDDVSLGSEEYRFVINTVKECLANGIRHGKATAFYLEMKKSFSDVCLLVSDNGCGIDGGLNEGFGLKGMREKAEALGGKCCFSSESGEGFEVEITLPLKEDEKEKA